MTRPVPVKRFVNFMSRRVVWRRCGGAVMPLTIVGWARHAGRHAQRHVGWGVARNRGKGGHARLQASRGRHV